MVDLWAVEEWALNFVQMFIGHWPALAMVVTLLVGVALAVRAAALTSESAAQFLGPIGKFFQDRKVLLKGEIADLRERVVLLDQRVKAMMLRDECYFDFMVYDAAWHNVQELRAAEAGLTLEPHVSFLVFRDAWMRNRGLDRGPEIWE